MFCEYQSNYHAKLIFHPLLSSSIYLRRQATLEPMNINICRIKMSDYEQHHYDKETLKQSATIIGSIDVNPTSDLEAVRVLVNKMSEEGNDSPKLSPDWCFIDCKCNDAYIMEQFPLFNLNFNCNHSMYGRALFPC